MIRRLISLSLLVLSFPVLAEDDVTTEVTITATRLTPEEGRGSDRIQVITRADLESWSGSTLADILARGSFVDMRRRSPAQADLSIRGSGFEHVLVLIDGVEIGDPQTGHHNLDLPLAPDDIERIEILPGVGSSVYGPGAYSGVINIVTRSGIPAEAVFRSSGGSFASVFSSVSVAGNAFADTASMRFSSSLERTDGHRTGTESLSFVASHGSLLVHPGGITRLRVGYLDRHFGADGFYGPYPAREETGTLFMFVASTLGEPGSLEILPRLSFRRHTDFFLLDRNQPLGYHSDHSTGVLGAELTARLGKTRLGDWALGFEHRQRWIESSSLGDHDRQRQGVFLENRIDVMAGLQMGLGVRLDWGGGQEEDSFAFASPSLELRFAPGPAWSVTLAAGRGFRLPSFTELYYQSPANLGDPSLGAESSWAGDLTAVWRINEVLSVSGSTFIKSDTDLVDWIKDEESEPWRATNIGSMVTYGGELRLGWRPRGDTLVELGYTRLGLSRDQPALFSKYVFRQPTDDILLRARGPLVLGLHGALTGRYRRRPDEDGYLLMDARLQRLVGPVEIFLEALNILDAHPEEIPGAPGPGFALLAGISLACR